MADVKYSVYKHINKINGKIYIGITSLKVCRRWCRGKGYKTQFFYNAIQEFGWDNFEHIILFNNLTFNEAEDIEKELIEYHKSNLEDFGYNKDSGGLINKMVSESTKEKMRKNNWVVRNGGKLPLEVRQKISKSQIGKKLSDEHKLKISKGCKGKNCGSKNGMFGKPGTMTGKFGELNPVYGRSHTEDEKRRAMLSNPNRKPIICIETQEKFNSINDASKKIGISRECIRDVCNGRRKSTHGLHFKYLTKG